MPTPAIDLKGQRFGRLTVVGRAENRHTSAAWACLCDCGTQVVRSGGGLRLGQTLSCGCLRAEKLIARNSAGKKSRDKRTYEIWRGMIRRCEEPTSNSFKNYGAKGITVCEAWRTSFDQFVADMGQAPCGGSIERINNEAGYTPSNCKWIALEDQPRNRRNVTRIVIGDADLTIPQACAHFGVKQRTAYNRLRLGWSLMDAVSHPVIPAEDRRSRRKA